MIKSIRHKGLKRFFAGGDGSGLPVPNHDRVRRQLAVLHGASKPSDLDLPGYRYHPLKGVKRHAIWVSGNYRITYGWHDNDAIDVDIEDYH